MRRKRIATAKKHLRRSG